MLYGILVALHLIVSVILILVVLLQTGKGADLAGAFGGGGSQTAFGSRGAATVLSKLTTTAAVVFMLTSFTLAIFSARGSSSVLEETGVGREPVAPAAAPAAAQPPTAEPLPAESAPAESDEGGSVAPMDESADPGTPPAEQPDDSSSADQ